MREHKHVPPFLFRSLALFLAVVSATSGFGLAETPRVLPAGEKLADVRLGELKNLNGYFPFTSSGDEGTMATAFGDSEASVEGSVRASSHAQQAPSQRGHSRRRRPW